MEIETEFEKKFGETAKTLQHVSNEKVHHTVEEIQRNIHRCTVLPTETPRGIHGCTVLPTELPRNIHGCTVPPTEIPRNIHGCTVSLTEIPREMEGCTKCARTMKEAADRRREAKSKVSTESVEEEIVAEEPEEIVAEEPVDGQRMAAKMQDSCRRRPNGWSTR